MAKRVQVALTESIASLGKEGDLVEVAPGYARNFLLPYGKAMNVTPAVLKQIERKKEKEKIAADKLKQEALDFQTALSTIGRFTIKTFFKVFVLHIIWKRYRNHICNCLDIYSGYFSK